MSIVKYGNVQAVPLALGVFLATDDYDYNPNPNAISVTTLLKPIRQIILPSRIQKEGVLVDLAGEMANRLGSAIHHKIEHAWVTNYRSAMMSMGYPLKIINRIRINPSPEELLADETIIPIYMEQRLTKQVGRWQVTGKFDFIGEGMVQDFKTASVWSYQNQVNHDKQVLQGSLYRWLDPVKITQDIMQIHHIFMDWKASRVGVENGYPPQRFATQRLHLRSVVEMDRYVRNKLDQIDKLWSADESLIPLCSDEELWRSEPKYKYYKSGDITAAKSTKNFDDKAEAYSHQAKMGMGAIKEVLGTVKGCHYCPGFLACSQKDDLIRAGELIL